MLGMGSPHTERDSGRHRTVRWTDGYAGFRDDATKTISLLDRLESLATDARSVVEEVVIRPQEGDI